MPFTSLGLSESLLKALEQQNYAKPYPIQKQAIPVVLQGRDMLGIAQTGSGKTASFVLPILEQMRKAAPSKNRHVRALVLVPTRELAIQVEEVFRLFSDALPERVKSLAVYGGVSINPQMIKMQGVEILVATPGRLLDLVDSNAVSLSEVQVLVLDEADKMLNLGFRDEMADIFKLLPVKRQNLLFSATLSKDVTTLNDILLRDPVVVKVEAEEQNLDNITQLAYYVTPERKGPLLRYLIDQENMEQVLIFVSETIRADAVVVKLRQNGIKAAALHGKKSQGARTQALADFKAGRITVLVATDLASRGIDIEFLPYVINYELPRSPKDYIHRIGRTGRAEAPGTAISLVCEEDRHHFKVIQKKMGRWVNFTYTDDINLQGF
ncbi:DEAD/DEAH box helicase [uncultured Acetobacteroides sp.]|uniref:DEAD/DEAH box helicase n=1 Tax=uncultured Acetobacteroides sp. TaxID=1760811 RepID=UPI0029F5B599|nr:DEAD/DEAH box helicase [uncultured Acetobacteroides sp.]